MPGPKIRYTQTVIGSCGHVLEGWGAISRLGVGTFVPCPDCSVAKTGLPIRLGDVPEVWVRIDKEKDAKPRLAKPRVKGAPKAKKTAKPKRAWQVFLADD